MPVAGITHNGRTEGDVKKTWRLLEAYPDAIVVRLRAEAEALPATQVARWGDHVGLRVCLLSGKY